REELVDHEPDLGLGRHTDRRRGTGLHMQVLTPRAAPLPQPDGAVSALDARAKAGLLISRIDNGFDVMLLKVPVGRQQSSIRIAEPNRDLTSESKSSRACKHNAPPSTVHLRGIQSADPAFQAQHRFTK